EVPINIPLQLRPSRLRPSVRFPLPRPQLQHNALLQLRRSRLRPNVRFPLPRSQHRLKTPLRLRPSQLRPNVQFPSRRAYSFRNCHANSMPSSTEAARATAFSQWSKHLLRPEKPSANPTSFGTN